MTICKARIVCAAAALLANEAVLAACPPGFAAQASGYCYAALVNASGTSFTWTAAQAACQATGALHANLASFRDAAQRNVVLTQRCGGLLSTAAAGGKPVAFWIGLSDDNLEGSMQWVSGASTTTFDSATSSAVVSTQFDNGAGAGSENFVLAFANGTLADSADTPSAGLYVGACCEAAAVATPGSMAGIACPTNFTGPDASGFCYSAVKSAFGMTWSQSIAACRLLNDGQAHVAAMIDATTATSIVTDWCNGTMQPAAPYWTGLRHTAGGSTSRSSPGWRWLGSGHRNSFITSPAGSAFWYPGEPNNSNGNVRRCRSDLQSAVAE